jgi:type II secretory pathway pseudopilin PulG
MNIFEKQKNKGFTIVEAIIAIFILSISISAMLGLTVSSYSTAKYANNEITANYLLQEAIDSIRNSRDTAFQQKNWVGFKTKYTNCFSANGCTISTVPFNPVNPTVGICNESGGNGIPCPIMQINGVNSIFKRQIIMKEISLNEIEITATVEYRNGTSVKTRKLKMNLMNWQAD